MEKNSPQRINRILLDVSDKIRAGVNVSIDDVLANHPDCAADLRSPLVLLLSNFPHMDSELVTRRQRSDEEVERVNKIFDDLTITRVINRGAQATVYEATEKKYGGRQVAVKIFDQAYFSKAAAQRFESEVNLTARLNHPNIVRLYQRLVVEGSACIIMEFVAGAPIDSSLTKDGYSARRCVEIFVGVCEAVAHAHNMGVLHRDLKPTNILLDTYDVPRVVDFGLAKDLLADSSHASVGMVIGTLMYMAPELARGESWLASIQSDVYSLGVVLHECLCGDYPFDPGETAEQLQQAVLSPHRKTLRACLTDDLLQDRANEFDSDLQSILSRAMAHVPSDRYSSASELAEDLSRWLRGDPIRAKSDRMIYVLGKQLTKYRRSIAVAAAFVLVATAGIISTSVLWRRTAAQRDNFQTALTMAGVNAFANMQRDSGRVDSAIELLGQVLDLGDSVSGLPEVSRSSFRAASSLAQIYLSQGDFQRAIPHVGTASDIVVHLRESDPNNPEWIRLDVHAHYLQGKLQMSEGNFGNAIALLEKAGDLHAQLPQDKHNGYGVQNTAAQILSNRARCFMLLNKPIDAINAYSDLCSIRSNLIDDDPTDYGRIISLAYAMNGLASSCIKANSDKYHHRATTNIRNAIALLEGIPKKFRRMRIRDIDNLEAALNYNMTLIK